MRLAASILLMLAVSLLTGCGSPYINIPAQPGDIAAHDPNNGSVWRIEVAALSKLLSQRPEFGTFTLKLPDGTLPSTYKTVLEQLPAGGNAWQPTGGFTPIYEVAAVYIRGATGQVDIVRPFPGDQPGDGQLVSFDLHFGFDGWRSVNMRIWNIPVSDALKASVPTDSPATSH